MLSWLEISESALLNNYDLFARIVGKERLAPVVKSNAYGHGFSEVASILFKRSPEWIGTSYSFEGAQLRKLGYKGRVLVMGPMDQDSLVLAAQENLEVFVSSDDALSRWTKLAKKPKAHVKFDTGMSRQGFLARDAGAVAQQFAPHKADVAGVCTHFANIEDVTEQGYAFQQLGELDIAVAAFRSLGMAPMVHSAASAACLILEKSRMDLARVGISLYGLWPSQATKISYLQEFGSVIDLKPVLAWRTRISQVKPVEAGKFIGYGCTYRAIRDMRVAVLPVGYNEGYPRIAGSTSSYVLVLGRRCPVVGRLCMNMMMVDVSHVAEAAAGDVVTLIGTDGNETIAAGDLAGWAQTIHYEAVTRLHPDIPRRLVT